MSGSVLCTRSHKEEEECQGACWVRFKGEMCAVERNWKCMLHQSTVVKCMIESVSFTLTFAFPGRFITFYVSHMSLGDTPSLDEYHMIMTLVKTERKYVLFPVDTLLPNSF